MNSAKFEIYRAIREAQSAPAIISYLCLTCKGELNDWDVQKGYAICWRCRRVCSPTPKVEEQKPELRKATLLQLKDGKYAVLLD
jgi:hypothetical protein